MKRSTEHADYYTTPAGYGHDEIDLFLEDTELTSLSIALKDTLRSHGVEVIHDEVISVTDGREIHPGSHVGVLLGLWRRIDAARHGRHTWNNRPVWRARTYGEHARNRAEQEKAKAK